MSDPFKLTGPTCLSCSGGRSSACLLWRVLQANTPEDIARWLVVLFCNTGKEREATLRFVRDCGAHWGVAIVWLEYRPGSKFAIVDFETASRAGEPFDAIITQRGHILPNMRSPYCSSELKTRTMHRYLRSVGVNEWDTFIGIRADEPIRVSKFRANPSPETRSEEIYMPLAEAGITASMVGDFWRAQPFDLGLPNHNGTTPEGNCDLCFKKAGAKLVSIISARPESAVWWAEKEAFATKYATGDGCRFRIDRPGYAAMAAFARDQVDAFDKTEHDISCFCGD